MTTEPEEAMVGEQFKVKNQHIVRAQQRRISELTDENVMLNAAIQQLTEELREERDRVRSLEALTQDEEGEPDANVDDE